MAEPGGLRAAVDALAAEAEQQLAPEDAPFASQIRAALMRPLAVAVVGRVSSGKSTLVNALIGSPIAATDATDCTTVVTWFRHGRHPAASVVRHDGSEVPLLISTTGTLPTQLPVPLEEVDRVEVREAADALRRMVLVDTPGLANARGEHSSRTERLMGDRSGAEAQRADAVVFVFNGSLKADEAEAVDVFLRGESAPDVAGTIGVLTKADIGPGPDPLGAAQQVADTLAREHTRLFSTVVAVGGLLAETVRCGRLTEAHARAVAALADAWDEPFGEIALSDVDVFSAAEGPVEAAERRELLRRLGLHGVRLCLAEARAGRRRAHELNASLAGASGFARLEDALDRGLGARVDALKARRGLGMLSDLAYGLRPGQEAEPPAAAQEGRRWLRARLEEAVDSPALQPLALLEAAHLVNTGRVALPEPLEADLRALVGALPGLPDAGPGGQALQRWRGFALLAAPPQRAVASAAIRTWELAFLQGSG